MGTDVIKDAMIRRAKAKAKADQARERYIREYEEREARESQSALERLALEREFIHDAQQTIKGINDAIMAHFGKKE
ncbi:MAG: DNA-binding protein [Prevotella sp.]|jgi:hypothetical protein